VDEAISYTCLAGGASGFQAAACGRKLQHSGAAIQRNDPRFEPYTLKGVIWFQGDGNCPHPQDYGVLFKTLITSWRAHFHDEHLPFYYVEMQNYGKPQQKPVEPNALSEIREQQQRLGTAGHRRGHRRRTRESASPITRRTSPTRSHWASAWQDSPWIIFTVNRASSTARNSKALRLKETKSACSLNSPKVYESAAAN